VATIVTPASRVINPCSPSARQRLVLWPRKHSLLGCARPGCRRN